jgi:hypothetical protein
MFLLWTSVFGFVIRFCDSVFWFDATIISALFESELPRTDSRSRVHAHERNLLLCHAELWNYVRSTTQWTNRLTLTVEYCFFRVVFLLFFYCCSWWYCGKHKYLLLRSMNGDGLSLTGKVKCWESSYSLGLSWLTILTESRAVHKVYTFYIVASAHRHGVILLWSSNWLSSARAVARSNVTTVITMGAQLPSTQSCDSDHHTSSAECVCVSAWVSNWGLRSESERH